MPKKVDWSTHLFYTAEEGLELIQYSRWLYLFARYILADMDDAETAFCLLPFMTEDEVRARVEHRVYSDFPYGSEEFQNMALDTPHA